MSQKEDGSLITFFVGLMSGVVIGTVAGLLSAPDKIVSVKELGKDSIEKVKNSLRDKAHKLSVKLDELAKQGSEVLIQDEVH